MTYTIPFGRARWSRTLQLGLAASALALLVDAGIEPCLPSSSGAGAPSVHEELRRALNVAGQPPPTARAPGVRIAPHAHSGVALATGPGVRLTVGLPATGAGHRIGETMLYQGRGPANRIAAQPTASGARVLVLLSGASAPQRYRFPVSGAAALRHRPDGGVSLLGAGGRELGVIAAPWARDAAGRAVPTRYAIEGRTLVQVVEHAGRGVTYPIVADPNIWRILKCAGSIVAAIVSVAIPAAKVIQLVKFVKAVGGVREAAKLLLGATTKAEKLRAIRKAVGAKSATAVAAALLGIPGVRDNCF
ncbi:MAG: hypothetical protein AVDCRST_MAG67-219 [uncultured Solirubrobacteraceae bacterium]|uniref:Uncharacterized protein n=1 Tax=uncultured Solirubrobacteraceae bacterium TaxID=1162706 RepID=A0A6J4RNE1_9ACTN|nr:MAG: hypothetical protein AVDCRST_MAG67-219 [uncultured Solirubrobacteraceae bacterium]